MDNTPELDTTTIQTVEQLDATDWPYYTMGRHLIDRMDPGPEMGAILARAYEAQLDGAFSNLEGALDWLNGPDY